ncbi:MAG: response regulator, partial [Eubacterium sp.]|nr:response regulator [Eubacterium sp.]
NKMKRQKRFLYMALLSNCSLFIFMAPDAFLPMLGVNGVSTSGIGGAVCAIVMWYGATQLISFDIRMGHIKDKVFDFLEAGIIVLDTDHHVSLINRYAEQLVKTENGSEWMLSDFFNFEEIAEDDIYAEAENGIYSGGFWDKSGARAFSVRVKAVEDDYGDPFCFMCVFLDMTEELEAAKKLEIASQAKSRFLAQMSHEIRTPINAVLGMNEMILREANNKDILEYAENIESAGNTLLVLINSILDFSKIEDGKMDIVPVRYDTASFINDLFNSVAQRADSKGLSLKINVDDKLPSAMIGDDVRLSQVIMNLLTNAVKYTEKGSVTLSVLTESREDDRICLFVSVKDTGIGIRREDIHRLFESFERLDEVKNHNIEGTGLGISIVKSLLTMMGSKLNVVSTYGEGSEFSFSVEQKIADATPIGDYEGRVKKSHRKRGEEDLIHASRARILVVDDNDMNLKVTRNLLKLCGIRPELVSSGEDAIESVRKNSYDCIFLDHMMPGMDGIETLNRMRAESLIPDHTTVIALTANAVVGSREAYLAAGFRDYLSKPIEVRELIRLLKKYLPEDVYDKESLPDPDRETSGKPAQKEKGTPESSQKGAPEIMEFSPDGDPEIMEFSPDGDSEIMEFSPDGDSEIMEFSPDGDSEIMEFSSGDHNDVEKKSGSYDVGLLKQAGLDTEAGLHYCAGDRDFYFEMLEDYVAGCEEKLSSLNGFYEEKNWHQYGVLVHAMKSNLRTLGAAELSEQARALEEAAVRSDEAYLIGNHSELVTDYRKLAEKISHTKK